MRGCVDRGLEEKTAQEAENGADYRSSENASYDSPQSPSKQSSHAAEKPSDESSDNSTYDYSKVTLV